MEFVSIRSDRYIFDLCRISGTAKYSLFLSDIHTDSTAIPTSQCHELCVLLFNVMSMLFDPLNLSGTIYGWVTDVVELNLILS